MLQLRSIKYFLFLCTSLFAGIALGHAEVLRNTDPDKARLFFVQRLNRFGATPDFALDSRMALDRRFSAEVWKRGFVPEFITCKMLNVDLQTSIKRNLVSYFMDFLCSFVENGGQLDLTLDDKTMNVLWQYGFLDYFEAFPEVSIRPAPIIGSGRQSIELTIGCPGAAADLKIYSGKKALDSVEFKSSWPMLRRIGGYRTGHRQYPFGRSLETRCDRFRDCRRGFDCGNGLPIIINAGGSGSSGSKPDDKPKRFVPGNTSWFVAKDGKPIEVEVEQGAYSGAASKVTPAKVDAACEPVSYGDLDQDYYTSREMAEAPPVMPFHAYHDRFRGRGRSYSERPFFPAYYR